MLAEVTKVFRPEERFRHVDILAMSDNLSEASFGTADFGEVTIKRGDTTRPGFLAQSEGFNVSVIVGPDGDQAAILTYDFSPIVAANGEQVASLREQVDQMLKQCNSETRR